MYSSVSQYIKDTRYDKRGVKLLSAAVLRQAYLDYVDALEILSAIRDPYQSANTFRKYGVVFRKCSKRLRDAYRKAGKKGKFYNEPEKVWKHILEYIDNYYYIIAARLLDNKDFLTTDRLRLFSETADGNEIIKMAEEEAKRWQEGKAKYYTSVGLIV